MSRITDLVDQAGATDAPPPTPRAVVATDPVDADAVWRALCADAGLAVSANEPALGLVRLHVPVEPPTADVAPREDPATLVGDYRGHPVHVPALPAGRVLLHALRLLEEDPLSDMDAATRDATCAAAVAYALGQESAGVPWASRLTPSAVDAYLASSPDAWSPPPTPAGAPAPLDALLLLDALEGGVTTTRTGLPMVLVRAGRPSLLAVAAGQTSHSAALLVDLVVATLDLGDSLSTTLTRVGPGRPALAMWLDERGSFQAASTTSTPIHVRGYERDGAS